MLHCLIMLCDQALVFFWVITEDARLIAGIPERLGYVLQLQHAAELITQIAQARWGGWSGRAGSWRGAQSQRCSRLGSAGGCCTTAWLGR